MSSSPSIDWVLDKVADLAGGSREDDAALKVLLTLVGSLDPPPKAVKLEPVASRIGKLRLAEVLDHPSDLRIGAVRLLAALDVSSLPTTPAKARSEEPAPETIASSEPAPAPPPAVPRAPETVESSAPAPETIASSEPAPAPPPAVPRAPETVESSAPAPEATVSNEPTSAPEPIPEQAPQAPSEESGVTPPREFRRAGGRVVLSFPHPGEEADVGRGNGAS